MLIQCPECQFSRTLDESKIPASAQIATCPRCKARFRFRGGDDSDQNVPAGPESSSPEGRQEDRYQQPEQDSFVDRSGYKSAGDDSGNTPGPGQQPSQPPEQQDENKPRDIWDHIALLGEKWDQRQSEQKHGQGRFQPRSEDGGFEAGARAGIVPWEHPERFGQVGGFFKTIMRVLMRGKLFFSSMPHSARMARPMLYYFLIIAVHFLVSFFWIYLFSQNAEVAANLEQFNATMSEVSFLQFAVFIPLNAALTLVMLGFTFSLLFRLIGIKNVSLLRNLRILCYASSGLVLVVVPIIGPIMSSLFVVFSTFQGFAYSYNLPPARAALLVFPVYLLLFLIVVGTSMSAM